MSKPPEIGGDTTTASGPGTGSEWGLDGPAAPGVGDESADWFRVLAETTSTSIFVYRERFLWCNRAFLELTGFSREELTAMDTVELVHPDYRELVAGRRDARLAGESVPQQYEILIITRSGEERWVHFTGGRIRFRGRDGGARHRLRHHRPEARRDRPAQQRGAPADGAARRRHRHLGLEPADRRDGGDQRDATLAGARRAAKCRATSTELIEKWVHPEDRRRLGEALRKTLKEGSDLVIEHRFVAPSGEVRWLTVRGQAIRDETGWVVRMVGVSADITERKLAELAVRESNDRLRLMVEQIPAVLWTTDRELRFTSSVGAALAGLGLKANQVVGCRSPST